MNPSGIVITQALITSVALPIFGVYRSADIIARLLKLFVGFFELIKNMICKKLKVLMTGAGSPGGPGIIKCLRMASDRWDLVVADANPRATGRYLAAEFVQLPVASDDSFIDTLMKVCLEKGIDLVLPLVTAELFKLAARKDEFAAAGIKVIVSDEQGLKVANDKIALYEMLKSASISVPNFRLAFDVDHLVKAAHALGYPEVSVVMKPGVSNGSRGVRVLDTRKDAFELLFREKPSHIYSTLDEILNIVGQNTLPPLLVSEYLPGEEITVDSIVTRGEIKFIVARVRERMNAGISVAGRFEIHDDIFETCTQIARLLCLDGPIGFQFKRSSTGKYQIIEMNPRLQGTSVAALGLGVNLPQLAIEYCLNPDSPPYLSRRDGIGFARFYDEIFYSI
jgi:carbamoyl-phosphate synthase large subunit